MAQWYVDFRSNPVAIPVSSEVGTVAKLKLQVKQSALEIVDVKVFIAGGESFDVALKAYLGAGDETRVIDIPGGPKVIEKVELTYRGGANDETIPLVRVFGAN